MEADRHESCDFSTGTWNVTKQIKIWGRGAPGGAHEKFPDPFTPLDYLARARLEPASDLGKAVLGNWVTGNSPCFNIIF